MQSLNKYSLFAMLKKENTKTGPVSLEEVVKAALKGVVNAQKDYVSWSEGWLWRAPEYLLTVYVAKEISKIKGSKFITLENSALGAIKEAGRGRGKLHSEIRENGRFDILLWWAKDKPRAPIEVKHQVTNANKIIADVRRIARVINRNKQDSSIGFGAIVFYTSCKEDKLSSANEKLIKSLKAILATVIDDVGSSCQVSMQKTKIYLHEDSAWSGAAIVLKSKNT